MRPEPIHRWDLESLLKSVAFGAVLEAAMIAPAVLSTWGHAGPESLWGWLGLLLNVPGLFVLYVARIFSGSQESVSVTSAVVYVYLIQTTILTYPAFVFLRIKKRKREAST